MKRRTFLQFGAFSGVSLALGSAAYRVGACWWDQSAGSGLRVLSDDEAAIFVSIADTLFPGERFRGGMPAASSTGAVAFFDDYLLSVDERTSRLLRVLLHAIDDVAILSDLSARRFRDRPVQQREEILRAWDRSWFSARRGAFTSLKLLISMGYTEHPAVIRAAGFDYLCRGSSERMAGAA